MIIAASVAGVLTDTVGRLSGAIDDQGLRVSEDVRTDVEVISDSGSDAVYNASGGEVVVVHLKNTGSETLSVDTTAVDVFLDGTYETGIDLSLVGDDDVWRPGAVVRLEIDRSSNPLESSIDHRLKVIVNGDEEVFNFRS
jgi:flagellar protein FlaG